MRYIPRVNNEKYTQWKYEQGFNPIVIPIHPILEEVFRRPTARGCERLRDTGLDLLDDIVRW